MKMKLLFNLLAGILFLLDHGKTFCYNSLTLPNPNSVTVGIVSVVADYG